MTISTRYLILLLLIALVAAAVGCGGGGNRAAPAPVASARASSLEADLRTVKSAVDAYMLQSGTAPTGDGRLPPVDSYAPIDFHASFTKDGRTVSLYPDFILELPRHWDEQVWRMDSVARVYVAIASRGY